MMQNYDSDSVAAAPTSGKCTHHLRRQLTALLAVLAVVMLPATRASADDVIAEERDVSGFSGIVLRGSGDLFITQGDSEALTITAEPKVLEVITSEVRDGVLHIGWQRGSNVRTREPIRFDVSLRDLSRLGMSGSGDAFMSRLDGDRLTINISGSSDVEFGEVLLELLEVTISGSGDVDIEQLDATSIDASISGSGEIKLAGRAVNQDISVSGSGDYVAPELASEVVSATVIGSGLVRVWAEDNLEVTVTGSGDVIYRGSPEVSVRVSGSGKVRAEN